MKSAACILALALFAIGGPARAQLPRNPQTADGHYPGPLETFLENAKAPTLETKIFGSFEGEQNAKVTFKALIAGDSANREGKLRGLAIELARGTCRHTAYVDVDVSKPDEDWLKESIIELQYIEDKQAATEYWRTKGAVEAGTFGSVQSGLPPSAKVSGLTQAVLNVGWHKPKDGDLALAIDWIPCRNLLFPKATMTDVIKAMSAAHDYLWSH